MTETMLQRCRCSICQQNHCQQLRKELQKLEMFSDYMRPSHEVQQKGEVRERTASPHQWGRRPLHAAVDKKREKVFRRQRAQPRVLI